MVGREKECEYIDFKSKLEALWPKKTWSFKPESFIFYDRVKELELCKDFCSRSRVNEMELYSTLRIYQQIEKDNIEAPTDDEYFELSAGSKEKDEVSKTLESSNCNLMEKCLDKAEALQEIYQKRVDIVNSVKAIVLETERVEVNLTRVNSQKPHNKTEEKERLKEETDLLEKEIKTLTNEIDKEEEMVNGLNILIQEYIQCNEELENSLVEANSLLQGYQQTNEEGNFPLAELEAWLEAGVSITQRLNQIIQVEAHGFNHLEVVFDLAPIYPCLIIKHSNFAEGFDINFLKLTKTFIDPTQQKENENRNTFKYDQLRCSYEDFEEIRDIDLSALLDRSISLASLENDQVIPELIGATYHELVAWLSTSLDQP